MSEKIKKDRTNNKTTISYKNKKIFNALKDEMTQVVRGLKTKVEFYEWLDQNIKIYSYVPIEKKYAYMHVINIIFPIQYQSNNGIEIEINDGLICEIIQNYEKLKIFDVLFYYTDLLIDEIDKNDKIYDNIIVSGLYNYIIKFCKEDYNRFVNMLDSCLGINNLASIISINQSLQNIPTSRDVEKLQNIFNSLNENSLNTLNEFIKLNDSNLSKLSNSIKYESKKEINN